jgi:hypothetical protein
LNYTAAACGVLVLFVFSPLWWPCNPALCYLCAVYVAILASLFSRLVSCPCASLTFGLVRLSFCLFCGLLVLSFCGGQDSWCLRESSFLTSSPLSALLSELCNILSYITMGLWLFLKSRTLYAPCKPFGFVTVRIGDVLAQYSQLSTPSTWKIEHSLAYIRWAWNALPICRQLCNQSNVQSYLLVCEVGTKLDFCSDYTILLLNYAVKQQRLRVCTAI